VRTQPIVRWTLRVIWVRSVMCCLALADKEQRNRSESVSLIGKFPENLGFQEQAVPFTPQTRLAFDVILPLWGHRGPCPTLLLSVRVQTGHLLAQERLRS
jgi:hypothetical protein